MADFVAKWDKVCAVMGGFKAHIELLDGKKASHEQGIAALEVQIGDHRVEMEVIDEQKREVERKMTEMGKDIAKDFLAGEGTKSPVKGVEFPAPMLETKLEPTMDRSVEQAEKEDDEASVVSQAANNVPPADADEDVDDTDATFEAISDMFQADVKRERSPSSSSDSGPSKKRTAPKATKRQKLTKDNGVKKEPVRAPRSTLLAPTHPTVVRHPDTDTWVELRCDICGANYNGAKKVFFSGIDGFMWHFIRLHKDVLDPGERLTVKSVLRRCIHRTLTAEEAGGVMAGEANAYVVEKLPGGRKAG